MNMSLFFKFLERVAVLQPQTFIYTSVTSAIVSVVWHLFQFLKVIL